MFRTVEEAKDCILASGRQIPISDALAALAPIARWREPETVAEEAPISLAARIAWAFRQEVEQSNQTMAARLPMAELYAAARAHVLMNAGVQKVLALLSLEQLARLAFAPMHSNDAATLAWHGVWLKDFASIPPDIRERRVQASEAAPFLAGIIPYFSVLRNAVDDGKPLFEAAEKIGLGKNIGAIANLRLPMVANKDSSPDSFIAKLQVLRDLPPDWLKQAQGSSSEQAALARIFHLSRRAQELDLPPQTLTTKFGGKWMEHLTRIAKSGMDRRPPESIREDEYRMLRDRLPFSDIAAVAPLSRLAVARFHAERLYTPNEGGATLEDVAAWAARIAAPDTSHASLVHILDGMRHMTSAFAAKVLTPFVLYEAGASGQTALHRLHTMEKIAADILCGTKAGPRIAEITRTFLNNEARIIGAAGQEGHEIENVTKNKDIVLSEEELVRFGLSGAVADPTWPMIARPVMAPNGLAVVPLWSKGHLEDEGRGWNGNSQNEDGSQGLSICVGANGYYLGKCLGGRAQILSIRRLGLEGEPVTRISCVELNVKSVTEVSAVQHRGRQNSGPAHEATQALNWWLDNIGDTIPFNPVWQEFVRQGGISNNTKVDACKILCGYNWLKRHNIEHAWTSWRETLGKDVPDLASILSRPDVKELIKEISPLRESEISFANPR